jgi:hypothetical protein
LQVLGEGFVEILDVAVELLFYCLDFLDLELRVHLVAYYLVEDCQLSFGLSLALLDLVIQSFDLAPDQRRHEPQIINLLIQILDLLIIRRLIDLTNMQQSLQPILLELVVAVIVGHSVYFLD